MFHHFFDRFKSDKQLIEEESALFQQVVAAEQGQGPLTDEVYTGQVDKAAILIRRGYTLHPDGSVTQPQRRPRS